MPSAVPAMSPLHGVGVLKQSRDRLPSWNGVCGFRARMMMRFDCASDAMMSFSLIASRTSTDRTASTTGGLSNGQLPSECRTEASSGQLIAS